MYTHRYECRLCLLLLVHTTNYSICKHGFKRVCFSTTSLGTLETNFTFCQLCVSAISPSVLKAWKAWSACANWPTLRSGSATPFRSEWRAESICDMHRIFCTELVSQASKQWCGISVLRSWLGKVDCRTPPRKMIEILRPLLSLHQPTCKCRYVFSVI